MWLLNRAEDAIKLINTDREEALEGLRDELKWRFESHTEAAKHFQPKD